MGRGEASSLSPDALSALNPRRAFEEDVARRAVAPLGMGPADRAREFFVRFLSNAIPVGVNRGGVTGLAVPYEDEAVHPNAGGAFRQLLFATAVHPAMLEYLDAGASVGPNSPAGRVGRRGLNENYAREVMELHTLGVDGGYTQDDVRELALALTGFGVERDTGRTMFRPERHEPGARRFMGRDFPEGDSPQSQAWAMLSHLADHPRTARRFCSRLARHLLGPAPPARLVDGMVRRWTATRGSLPEVLAHAVSSPEALRGAGGDMWRSPEEFVTGSLLALGVPADEPGLARAMGGWLRRLGQFPFSAPDPRGWPEDTSRWMSPDQVMDRAAVADEMSALCLASARRRSAEPPDPRELSARLGLPEDASRVVAGAPSLKDGLALVLLSPAFQRR